MEFLRPLRLSNGLYLNLQISLFIEETKDGPGWKVRQSRYQYQVDDSAFTNAWIFRYDFLRSPGADVDHPSAHLNVNANPVQPGLVPDGKVLPRIHFPTRRLSFERVLLLLVEEFQVPCATDRAEWRQLLAASEAAFLEIAHDPPLTG